MTDDADRAGRADDRDDDEVDRDAILARRRFLIRRAAATLGAMVVSGITAQCSPCLSPDVGSLDATHEGGAVEGGGADTRDDGLPMPCLSPVRDAGPDSGIDGGADAGGGGDAGGGSDVGGGGDAGAGDDAGDDAKPMACLRFAPDAGNG